MDNMGQTVLSVSEFARNIVKLNIDRSICHFDKEWPKCPWVNFFKYTSSSEKKLLMETYVEYLKGQYGKLANKVQTFTWSKFATNIAKVDNDRTICEFDKKWSMFSKWMI